MTTEAAIHHDATQRPAYRWWVLAAVECGNFVVYMDGFIVTLALPAMARHFGVGIHEIKWVLVAYLAALTLTLLIAGRLADRWGRKPVTVVGAALLTLAGALCALAPNLEALIAFRIVQGLGGSLVLANVMSEITAVFPKEQRRRAMAVNASVLALGQVTGLVLGGFLIGWLGWRSIFLVIVAVGGLGVVLDLAVLRNRATEPRGSLDWRGAVLSVLVVGAPFVLIERLSWDFQDPVGVAFLLGSLILLGLFVAVERRSAQRPRTPISLGCWCSVGQAAGCSTRPTTVPYSAPCRPRTWARPTAFSPRPAASVRQSGRRSRRRCSAIGWVRRRQRKCWPRLPSRWPVAPRWTPTSRPRRSPSGPVPPWGWWAR